MTGRGLRRGAIAFLLGAIAAHAVAQDSYPNRPVKIIAPQAPGGGVGHVRVTLKNGDVREASQDHFRGGREEPLSAEVLEAKFVANCLYGGWDADRAARALATLQKLRAAPRVRLELLRG